MWKINIKAPFGGYLKKYYLDDNISVGSGNEANDMNCININNNNCLTSGFISTSEETSEVIFKFSNTDVQGGIYGISDTKVWKIGTSLVSNAYWPHTISGAAVAGFWNNAVVYKDKLYYFWHTFTGGDIGEATNITGASPTFDDDWGSTEDDNLEDGNYTPVFVTLDNYLLFGNSQYLGFYDGTTLDTKFYDFGGGLEIKAIAEQSGYIYIAVNKKGSKLGYIYIINSDISIEANIVSMIDVGDYIEELYAINGIIYIFHKEVVGEDLGRVGYISGERIIDLDIYLENISGQITYANDYLFFSGEDGKVFAISTPNNPKQFLLSSPLDVISGISYGYGACKSNGSYLYYSTSDNAGNFKILKYTLDNQSISSYWISKSFITSDIDNLSMIDSIFVVTNSLKSEAKLNLEIYKNKEDSVIKTLEISGEDKTRHIFRNLKLSGINEFKIKLDWSVGTLNKEVEIQQIIINGHNYEL